jgi:conflict system STAND superfamily ATPase
MASSSGPLTFVASPFPGLRAFDVEDSLLFFGRETHTEALLRRLSEHRFVAVVGSSGCGKSSLVRAGLLPGLLRGYLVNATSRWRLVTLRPGTAPIDALAAVLAKDGVLGKPGLPALRATLGATSGGLVEVVRQAGLAAGESLLVTVDQFEEIFRYARPGRDEGESQASLFVGLLLRAVESDAPIYVTLTMRSDYQGDCAQFAGLSEALNRSQYLVPRLTRDQRREAIVRPLELVDAVATPRLVNRLLNDAGDDPDQLPVLQHALLRTYRHWQHEGGRGDLDVADYDAIGGIAHALGRHGDAILEASHADRRAVEKVFRSLTTTERGREVRRPQSLGVLRDVVGAGDEAALEGVDAIVSTFAARESSFLMLSAPQLEADTVVDITHESLIRKWPLLAGWVGEEARSAEWYGDLKRDVVRRRDGDAGLWRDPQLSEVLERKALEGWNEAWAGQYARPGDAPFEEVERFLGASVEARDEERRREEEQRRKEVEDAQALARAHRRGSILLSALLATIVAAVAVFFWLNQRTEARVAVLTRQYLDAQGAYDVAQQAASELRARYEQAASEVHSAELHAADPAEREKLRADLEELRRDYEQSRSKADGYQAQLRDLRKNQDLVSSDREALVGRVQLLQKQLTDVTADRDNLRVALDSRPAAPTAQLEAAARSLVVVFLPQNSIVYPSSRALAGKIAIGVGEIHREPSSYFRVYIWTSGGDALPVRFEGDHGRFQQALRRHGVKDVPEEACIADRPDGLSCYRVQGGSTIAGKQGAASFTLSGTRYEIRAVGWTGEVRGYPDSVSLLVYQLKSGG